MRKNFALLLMGLFAGFAANAQLVNNGATITVQSGATIKCTGAIINNSGGIIQNAGIVSSDGELRNEIGGTLTNSGTTGVFEATTKFVNYGNAFTALKLRLIGNVNTDSIKSGTGSTWDSVYLAKGAGTTATLSDAMTVNVAVRFDNDDNRLILEDENLIMGSSAIFVGADNNEFVQTNYTGVLNNSTGTVTKQSLASTPFIYEVGFGAGQYNPVTISNSGTSDNISVRCLQNVLDGGLTGTPVASDFANNSWVVTEALAGNSNLTMTGTWVSGDELSNFNRAKVGIARFNTGTDWDLPAGSVTGASGANPYTLIRSGILSTGVFAVADLEKVNTAKLDLKVFLQGAYSGGAMTDNLRSLNLIPATQPYSSAMSATRFNRVGVYDGTSTVNEHVTSTSVFDVTGTNDDIVDWVYISLQDGTTPATKLQTKAALLQRDGNIVEYDSATASYIPVRMPIDADGNYYIVVNHRNHLAVRTASSVLLQDGITMPQYNFTDDLAKAYPNPAFIANNAAMKDLGGGVFGLWAGNANANVNSRYAGSGNDPGQILIFLSGAVGGITSNVYSNYDLNMNGIVRYAGSGNDPGYMLNNVLGGLIGLIINEH